MAAMMIDAHINQETPPPQTIAEQAIEMAFPETMNAGALSTTAIATSRRMAFIEIAGEIETTACMRHSQT